jgi:hypothetical protein
LCGPGLHAVQSKQENTMNKKTTKRGSNAKTTIKRTAASSPRTASKRPTAKRKAAKRARNVKD